MKENPYNGPANESDSESRFARLKGCGKREIIRARETPSRLATAAAEAAI